MERNSQFESSIHCHDLIDCADDQSSTNVHRTSVHSPVDNLSIVHSLINVNSLEAVESSVTVRSALQTIESPHDSLEAIESSVTVHSALQTIASPTIDGSLEVVENPATVHSALQTVEILTSVDHSLEEVESPVTVHCLETVQSPTTILSSTAVAASCVDKGKMCMFIT